MNCHPSPRRAERFRRDAFVLRSEGSAVLRERQKQIPSTATPARACLTHFAAVEGMTIQFGATARAAALEEARRAALKLMSVLNQ